MSHLPLDARAILHYLNELGYRNISATQLKEFLKDLRKLIKYEDRMGVSTQQNDYYESLFRRTTASYRAKIDKENYKRGSHKRKLLDTKSSGSRQAATENRKVLGERNHEEATASSSDLLHRIHSSKSHPEKKIEDTKTDARSLKVLIEKILVQVLRDKYSQEFVEKDNICNKKSPIRYIVEHVLKEKLSSVRHPSRERLNSSEPGSLRSIIEDVVTQIVNEKLANLEKERAKSEERVEMKNLNQDMQQKLTVSKESTITLPREPVTHYNTNKPLNSQSLVQQLLIFEGRENKNGQNNKNLKKSIANKGNFTTSTTECVTRLQRSPRKKPEWQDPSLHDNILSKPVKAIRSQSPAASSSARSCRSKCASSVLIRRSKSQGRKPNSDPVALYQYYKNEWEHFRNQIPGETPHNRLRWHVRQRLLDPE